METLEGSYRSVCEILPLGTSLIAVSKTKPIEQIQSLYDLGHRDFGENKVQELLDKAKSLKNHNAIKWHFIGHLQSNKINALLQAPHLVSIHSIDSIKLLNKLLTKKTDTKVGLFIQVNTSNEEQKGGFFTLDEVKRAIELVKGHQSFYCQGLMTIGSIRSDDFIASAHKSFGKLKSLKDALDLELKIDLELSMGMSSDYKIALEYGAKWIRVGSTIFGKR